MAMKSLQGSKHWKNSLKPLTFQEAYERALSIERISKNEEDVMNRNKKREIGGSSYQNNFDKRPRYDNRGNNSSFGTNFRGNQGFRGGNNQARGQTLNYQPRMFKGCNKPYHHNTTCAGEMITCFECGGLGHRAANCPTRMSGNRGRVKRFNQDPGITRVRQGILISIVKEVMAGTKGTTDREILSQTILMAMAITLIKEIK
ncbi:Gag polyprotein [Bienertia sinuspersici]